MRISFYIALLMVFGFISFFITLKSPFSFDDNKQIIHNESIKKLENIPSLYLKSNPFLQNKKSIIGYFYKPLFYTFYTLLYIIGNGSPFPFHLFQLLIYNVNVILIFLLFTKFFERKLAFFLSFIFLIHPANVEVVTYIAALQEVLFFFFGVFALYLVTTKSVQKFSTVLLVSVLLLLSFLSKETGMLFLFMVLLFVFLFQKTMFKYYLLLLSIFSLIYFFLRISAASHPTYFMSQVAHPLPLNYRLFLIPKILYYYCKEIIFPTLYLPDLKYLQNRDIIQDIYPLSMIIFILIVLVVVSFCIKRYFSSSFLAFSFFCVWALIGIGIHSQILPLDVLVATRWLYFPIVGVLGMIGVVITTMKPYFIRYRVLFVILYLLYIGAFILETEKMNFIWKNQKAYIIQSGSHKK